jgi:hypothetical protein
MIAPAVDDSLANQPVDDPHVSHARDLTDDIDDAEGEYKWGRWNDTFDQLLNIFNGIAQENGFAHVAKAWPQPSLQRFVNRTSSGSKCRLSAPR